MKANYNVAGAARKEMVEIIGETVGVKPIYKFMPTCAYVIDNITVEKDGTMVWDERTNDDTIHKVMDALASAGFTAEPEETETPEAEPQEAKPDAAEKTAEETEVFAETAPAEKGTGLTVSLPMSGFAEGSIDNLKRLVESKATLIKKALGADRITIDTDGDKINFSWWDILPEPEEVKAYTEFLSALCKMAKEAKRVIAKEAEVESEKYAFRCFLLRLGFIGNDYKAQRKILMQRLSGSATFPSKEKANAFSAAQKAKTATAKEVSACE